jgi:hypothetical protein
MATKKIIVLSDGTTWESIDETFPPIIMEVTDSAFQRLCEGEEPNDLDDTDIVSTKHVDT